MIIFDIETGALPDAKLKTICKPYDPASIGKHPGEFDPRAVKLGNMKDPAKIEEKIRSARDSHEKDVADFELRQSKGEGEYWEAIRNRAALSASTGEVLAIGWIDGSNEDRPQYETYMQDELYQEAYILEAFWGMYARSRRSNVRLVGFNIFGFDIPFLVQRSWINGVDVPATVFTNSGYPEPIFVDLLKVWQCGNRNGMISLDECCRALELGSKPEGITGADFARLFRHPVTRDQAIAYLQKDLQLTWFLADRLLHGATQLSTSH